MTTLDIGKPFVQLCRKRKHLEAIDALYSPDAVSYEAEAIPLVGKVQKGIAAIKKRIDDGLKTASCMTSQ